MRRSGAVVAVCALTVLGGHAYGQNAWVNPGAGDWFIHSNWSGGVPSNSGPFHIPAVINNGGTAQIAAGSASAMELKVGDNAAGTLSQTGGTLAVTSPPGAGTVIHRVWVGALPGSNGAYQLSGSASQLTIKNELLVGHRGTGRFLQTGGTVTGPLVAIGAGGGTGVSSASGTGRWEISAGLLKTPMLKIGDGTASATFVQTGGTVTVGAAGVGIPLTIADTATASALYEMQAGTLNFEPHFGSRTIQVGRFGPGVFRQTGGTVSIGGMHVGERDTTGGARFDMSGGTLTTSLASGGEGTIRVGSDDFTSNRSSGSATQTGGDVVSPRVQIAYGQWTQTGGTVNAQTVNVAYRGDSNAQWTLNGGSVSSSEVFVGDPSGFVASNGTLSIGRGKLTTGVLQVADLVNASASMLALTDADADVTVSTKLVFGPKAIFTAVPGATIKMTGSQFDNRSTTPADLAGLNNLTLVFKGGASVLDPFEVAGADVGASDQGFDENFALASLRIGDGATVGRVQLIDAFDNHAATPDALYVAELMLGADSHLDLNGRTLYYRSFIDQGGTLAMNGGQLVRVPEPASLATSAFALYATTLRRRLRRRPFT